MKVTGIFKAGPFSLKYIDPLGTKPVCLVIGSALFYSRGFDRSFEDSYRMIYLDHRGFGSVDGDVNRSDYSLQALLWDIENFRIAHELGKICIIGHSAHGYIALEYAKKFQSSVSGICVIATGPSHGVHMIQAEENWRQTVTPGRKKQFEIDMANFHSKMVNDSANQFVLFCQAMRARSWVDYNRDISYLWQDVKAYTPAIDHLYGETFRDIKIEDVIEGLDLPVLIVLGKLDYQVAPYWTWNSIKSLFNRLTFIVFENSSHNPQVEESGLFFSEFSKWFTENISAKFE